MKKIRKLLDTNHYHLFEGLDYKDNEKIHKWKLYEKHNGWVWDNSEPIMTSDTHSKEDLYKFVKTHRALEYNKLSYIVSMIILSLMLVLSIINMTTIHSRTISGFVLGVNLMVCVLAVLKTIVSDSECKLYKKQFKERWAKYDNTTSDNN